MHPNHLPHPLATFDAQLRAVAQELVRLRAALKTPLDYPGKGSVKELQDKMAAKAKAEQTAVECCQDLLNAPTGLLEALKEVFDGEEYWPKAAHLIIFGDVTAKLQGQLNKSWGKPDPVKHLLGAKSPSAYLNARRTANGWTL